MLQPVEPANRGGMKRPCEGARDLPVFHTEWLRRKENSACSEGVRQVAEQYGNRSRCAEGSVGDHRLRRWRPWRRGRNLCLGEGRWRLGLRQLKVRICRCAGFLVELRCARPNRKHLKPALLISRHEHLLFHRLFAPILLRRFLLFRPFPFSARLFRPFGAVWPARPCVSSQTVSRPYPRSHQRHARYLR